MKKARDTNLNTAKTEVKAYIRSRARDMIRGSGIVNYGLITNNTNSKYGTLYSRRGITAYLVNKGLHNNQKHNRT